jgi:lysophospholipase L1-like esterase
MSLLSIYQQYRGRDPEFLKHSRMKNYLSLREIAARAGAMGARTLVVIIPYLDDFASYKYAENHRILRKFLDEVGIPYLDLYDGLKNLDAASLRAQPADIVHPNADGHRRIAEILYTHLVSGGFVPVK